MNTLTRTSYDTLLARAKEKADQMDQPVAIVVWDIKEDGDSAFDLVVCRKGYAGAEDMSGVNAILDTHPDAELLEMVGPTY
jgi:hypothetical protein